MQLSERNVLGVVGRGLRYTVSETMLGAKIGDKRGGSRLQVIVEKWIPPPPPEWRFQVWEILPGLFLSNRLVEPAGYESLNVDVIVSLDDWESTWSPPVPTNHIYVHYPIEDADSIDAKVREVARFVANLVSTGNRVLVQCVQGLNRSAMVLARALMFLGESPERAIRLIRYKRGQDEGFGALGNESFVRWLLAEQSLEP
jgi:protein-tyrosine phosphatase